MELVSASVCLFQLQLRTGWFSRQPALKNKLWFLAQTYITYAFFSLFKKAKDDHILRPILQSTKHSDIFAGSPLQKINISLQDPHFVQGPF